MKPTVIQMGIPKVMPMLTVIMKAIHLVIVTQKAIAMQKAITTDSLTEKLTDLYSAIMMPKEILMQMEIMMLTEISSEILTGWRLDSGMSMLSPDFLLFHQKLSTYL